MRNKLNAALASSVALIAAVPMAHAQGLDFAWEGEIEVGIESVFNSNVPGNEGKDPFLTFEQVGELSFGEFFSIVGGLTLEEITGPSNSIEDLGLYVDTLALQGGNDVFTVQVGKSAPSFGNAWDEASGYFGSVLAEDYELTEQLGIFTEVALSETLVLAASAFYADDTSLSRSAGFQRGKNRTSAGGAGNTGELDNFSIQIMKEFENSFFHVGARQLSRGIGDVDDETGFIIGGGTSFENRGTPVNIYFEAATFDSFGGSGLDAIYATLTAAYGITDSTELSAVFTHRDIDTVGETDIFSVGFDHELSNGTAIGAGIGIADDVGADENIFGISMVIPLGGAAPSRPAANHSP